MDNKTNKNSDKIVITQDNFNSVVFDGVTFTKSAKVTDTKSGKSVNVKYTFDLTGETLKRVCNPYVQNRVIAAAPRVRKQIDHFIKNPEVTYLTKDRFSGRTPTMTDEQKLVKQAEKLIAKGYPIDGIIAMLKNGQKA